MKYTDSYWETLLPIQWKVFAEHLMLDDKEKLESTRDIVEYHAAFQNYQTVKAVQDARLQSSETEMEEEEQTQSDLPPQISSEEAFFRQLQAMGINLTPETIDIAKNTEIKKQRQQQESEPVRPNTRQQLQQDMARVIR